MSEHMRVTSEKERVEVEWLGERVDFIGPNAQLEFIEWARKEEVPECIVVMNGEMMLWTDWLVNELSLIEKKGKKGIRW